MQLLRWQNTKPVSFMDTLHSAHVTPRPADVLLYWCASSSINMNLSEWVSEEPLYLVIVEDERAASGLATLYLTHIFMLK